MKEVKVVVRDLRKEISKDLIKSYEKEFLEMKMKEIKREKEEEQENPDEVIYERERDFNMRWLKMKETKHEKADVKNDSDEEFLFTYEKEPKMPKIAKAEMAELEVSDKGSSYQCDVCKKFYKNKKFYDRHYQSHYAPLTYDCETCERKYVRKSSFDNHICSASCSICERKFRTMQKLKIHMKGIHNLQLYANKVSCDSCGDCFSKKQDLGTHIKKCKLMLERKFSCDHCGKSFVLKGHLFSHVLTHINHRVECKFCHLKLKLKSLERHIEMFHPIEEGNFECKSCVKSFKSSVHLKNHMYIHAKRFQCTYCEKKFPSPSKLQKHMKFHKNPEEFQCKICGHQSTSKYTLQFHEKTHNKDREKRFKCHRCDFQSDYSKDLKKHLSAHEKRDKKLSSTDNVKCRKCPAILKNENIYKIHFKMKHGNRKNFECDLCGYRTTLKSNIRRHILNNHRT